MGPVFKVIVGGLAVLGGLTFIGIMFAPAVSLSLYSPYIPQYNLLSVRGSTLLKLLAHGGGETPPTTTQGLPFPIALRIKLFDTRESVAEQAYQSVTGETFSTGKFLFG